MTKKNGRSSPRRRWRSFTRRDGVEIDRRLHQGEPPRCPCCDGILEAEAESRIPGRLPLGACGFDLCCLECSRFWCVVQHTERSLRLLRMRRLAAAVRSVGTGPPTPRRRTTLEAGAAA